jgi:hypothetical protein
LHLSYCSHTGMPFHEFVLWLAGFISRNPAT